MDIKGNDKKSVRGNQMHVTLEAQQLAGLNQVFVGVL